MEGLESIEHLSELREAVAEAAVQPLNHHVALSRDAALGLLLGYGLALGAFHYMPGEFVQAAKPTWQLTTRTWFAFLQFSGAFVLSSLVVALHGGARSALRPLRERHAGLVLFLSCAWVVALLLREVALQSLSTSAGAMCEGLVLLVMPLLAVAFEREPGGAPRQYGLWPCLSSSSLRLPGCGVYPALTLLLAGAATAQWDQGVNAPAAGLAFGALSAACLGVVYTTASILLSADPSPLAPPALGWWVSLLCAPAFLLASAASGDFAIVSQFALADAPAAALVYTWEALLGGAAVLALLSVVHASSSLTAAVVGVIATTALKLVNTLLAGHSGPANWLGALLAAAGVCCHAAYLSLRAARRRLSRRAAGADALSPAAGTGKDGAAYGVDETSQLVRVEGLVGKDEPGCAFM